MRKFPQLLTVVLVLGVLVTAAFRSVDNSTRFAAPLQIRMGWVTVYVPGTGIIIQDADGATAGYFLDPNVRILPPPRADTLAIGSHVIILARFDPKVGSWVVFGIMVMPPTARAGGVPPTPTPTAMPSETPTETPTLMPSETPTETPTLVPSDTPTDTPTLVPSDTPTETATDTPSDTPTETATDTPTDTPTP